MGSVERQTDERCKVRERDHRSLQDTGNYARVVDGRDRRPLEAKLRRPSGEDAPLHRCSLRPHAACWSAVREESVASSCASTCGVARAPGASTTSKVIIAPPSAHASSENVPSGMPKSLLLIVAQVVRTPRRKASPSPRRWSWE